MAPSRHHPHDKLFRAVLADKEEAEGLSKAYLPETISSQLDWPTLTLVETSFVDEALADRESDVLYQVDHRTTAEPVLLYILFEHQSLPDHWMRLRLYEYQGNIWRESFKWHPEQKWLPPIVTLVFYQGETAWNHSIEFADLFAPLTQLWPSIPHFSHVLIDQSGISPNEVRGNTKAQIMQLLMLAAYHEPVQAALQQAAKLLRSLPATGGTDYLLLFVHYVAATQERPVTQAFVEAAADKERKEAIMLTYAEELLLEGEKRGEQRGEKRGEQKGKIETIENLLRMGMNWEFIEQATEIDEAQYHQLKRELAQSAEEAAQSSRALP